MGPQEQGDEFEAPDLIDNDGFVLLSIYDHPAEAINVDTTVALSKATDKSKRFLFSDRKRKMFAWADRIFRKPHLIIHMCDDDKIAFGVVDEHNPGDLKGIEELRQENDQLKKENEVCCLGGKINVKFHQIKYTLIHSFYRNCDKFWPTSDKRKEMSCCSNWTSKYEP